jgi:hypothetical protein
MKLALTLCILLFSMTIHADTPWLKKPTLYFYQDNSILAQKIGTDDEINSKAQQVYDTFIKDTAGIAKTNTEQPFYFVVVFNDKGDVKSWIKTEDQAKKRSLERTAKKAIRKTSFKSLSGATAIAFYFGIEGKADAFKAKPPILEEWDKIIKQSGKITASNLFEQLLAE